MIKDALESLKTAKQIKKEKPYYYVDCDGEVPFESESLDECKEFMIIYIENHKEEVENKPYAYNICMYNINVLY